MGLVWHPLGRGRTGNGAEVGLGAGEGLGKGTPLPRGQQQLRNVPGKRMKPAKEKERAQGPGKPGEERIYQRELSVWCPGLRWDREEKGQEH